MRIYSWNMLYRNKKADEAFDFIAHADCDIFCLQEVPEDFLKRLETLKCSIAYRTSVERLLPGEVSANFNVILSRYPIIAQKEIPFPDYWSRLPWRTRLFVNLMPSKYFSKIRNRGAHYADVQTEHGVVRVFNLHLVQAHPAWRLEEFRTALALLSPEMPTIVCGDFNTHNKPYTTLLNWILGGTLGDMLLYKRERRDMDALIASYDLVNPLSGQSTHSFSRSQLDHVLVSRSFSITSAEVLPDRHGSDHNPIFAEIE